MLMPCWNLAERSVKSSFRIVRFRFQLTVGRFFRVDRSLSVNVSNDFSLLFIKVSDHSSSCYEASRLSFSALRKVACPELKEAKDGAIIHISSPTGWLAEDITQGGRAPMGIQPLDWKRSSTQVYDFYATTASTGA